MSGGAPQVPDMLTGRCMCGVVTFTISEEAAGGRPLPLQSLPAAVRERILYSHFHPPQRVDDYRRDRGLRRYRHERSEGRCAATAPAARPR